MEAEYYICFGANEVKVDHDVFQMVDSVISKHYQVFRMENEITGDVFYYFWNNFDFVYFGVEVTSLPL